MTKRDYKFGGFFCSQPRKLPPKRDILSKKNRDHPDSHRVIHDTHVRAIGFPKKNEFAYWGPNLVFRPKERYIVCHLQKCVISVHQSQQFHSKVRALSQLSAAGEILADAVV
jgi:hypothetical protein